MKTISINEKFSVMFLTPLNEYEQTQLLLIKTGFKFTMEDVSKEKKNAGENYPYPLGGVRPEVVFVVDVKNVTEAAFLKSLISRV